MKTSIIFVICYLTFESYKFDKWQLQITTQYNDKWQMSKDKWQIINDRSRWQITNYEWLLITNYKWQMTNKKLRMSNFKY